MAQFEFIEWLAVWLLSLKEFVFEWDHGNSTKNFIKHRVEVERAEQVFRNTELLVPLGIQVAPASNEPRFGVLGLDASGAHLSISFTVRDGKIRVISIRPMSRKERKNYGEIR